MTIQDIKDELQEVKYYYGHKEMFDRALSTVSKNKVLEKVARYNDLVQDAPAQLFGFVCRYIHGEQHAACRRAGLGAFGRVCQELEPEAVRVPFRENK